MVTTEDTRITLGWAVSMPVFFFLLTKVAFVFSAFIECFFLWQEMCPMYDHGKTIAVSEKYGDHRQKG